MSLIGAESCSSVADPAFLLDSNILIYVLEDATAPIVRRIEQMEPGSVVTSTISVAEASIGMSRRGFGQESLVALLDIVPPLPFDAAAGWAYARIPFKRHRFDRLIAAHALSLGLTLVTDNPRDFDDVEGLRIENWTVA